MMGLANGGDGDTVGLGSLKAERPVSVSRGMVAAVQGARRFAEGSARFAEGFRRGQRAEYWNLK